MNIFLENVSLSSTSGPNHFAKKLHKYLSFRGVSFSDKEAYDKKLTFIQSTGQRRDLSMYLRLDGIYFNSIFDCKKMNYPIRKSYEEAEGVIFQTNFNKELIFKWFGEHPNYRIINNGADIVAIRDNSYNSKMLKGLAKYENIWSCAAEWHPYKRLEENIKYFQAHRGSNDCLVVAGNNPDYIVDDKNIIYAGKLGVEHLMSLFKISKYFLHLAYLDHCPNVVIDARASGCKIICSSAGGTKEIAGMDAIVIEEAQWDFSFIKQKNPPSIEEYKTVNNMFDSKISMTSAAKSYHKFLKGEK
jgi:glycosyltransferase involved in cell wall biosynthesis